MRIFKSHPLLKLVNSYLIDSPQPSNISFLWNFGSLLGFSLVIQIITGVTLAMHYNANVLEAFNSVEHIMRDVNNGWLIRYLHSNTASAFFFLVYLHIGRGLYYGSYKAPRTLVWTIGTVIFILMMAKKKWPNWRLVNIIYKGTIRCLSLLPFNRARTRAMLRVGPHNKDVLSIIICGMLGDWWADEIKGQTLHSIRLNIEQSVTNSAYIHELNLLLFELGYCSYFVPKLVKKSEGVNDKRSDSSVTRFNYRLTLFTFTSLHWIYKGFYHKVNGVTVKRVPKWIDQYITPVGLAHWIMQDGSSQIGQGIYLSTHSFTQIECLYLAKLLKDKFNLKTSVVKTGSYNQWRISVWKESMSDLVKIVSKHIVPEMQYKIKQL